jgi:uncharacterized protein YyaL (SSP411 family)
MPNRLAKETSPYLQQHKDNPVDWYAWGPEALAAAKETGKPILLSIGYSACHWCHVMAHESFEDEEVAAVMNELFVNIKVDREERPDIDQIYQAAQHLLTQRSGGWPLTMFLTADQRPFFGGTYFSKTPRYGLPGFPDLLKRVREFHDANGAEISEQNAQLVAALQGSQPKGAHPSALNREPIAEAVAMLAGSFDRERGGFGHAPKFPHPDSIELCLRHYATSGDQQALAMAVTTLEKMALGGIYDQVGGGFARYSVDNEWAIPHFEKMLYDNGPLLKRVADAWAITANPLFERVAGETAAWVIGEMQSPEGGYYSALDADSEGEEGKYYVWTPAEVRPLLDDDEWAFASGYFNLGGAPNFEEHRWHLNVARPELFDAALLDRVRAKLYAEREKRIRPGRDDKVLTSWNALMIEGMAHAALVFGCDDWLASARRALDFLRKTMWKDERLLATFKDGTAHLNAYLDDHAFLLTALLEMLQADFRAEDLAWAEALGDLLIEEFEDRESGGFFFTSHDHEALIQRPKPGFDNATPSGNGIAATALNRLAFLTGETRYGQAAERTLAHFWPQVARQPASAASLLAALDETLTPPRTLIVTGPREALPAWKSALAPGYRPGTIILLVPAGTAGLPAPLAKPAASGVAAYLCEGVTCLPPVSDLAKLREMLETPRMPADA